MQSDNSVSESRYRIERLLGAGAVGTVHCAYDTRLQRSVAIKIIKVGSDDKSQSWLRGEREIKSIGGLSHKHIVTLYDAFFLNGSLFLVMEFCDKGTLGDRMRTGIDIMKGLLYLRCILAALGHAHSLGVIHRDVKPSNILLRDGVLKLGDFGLARADLDQSLTKTGVAVGSPHYISPELSTIISNRRFLNTWPDAGQHHPIISTGGASSPHG